MSDAALIRDILTLGNQLKRSLEEEFIALTEKISITRDRSSVKSISQSSKPSGLKKFGEAAEASAERLDMSDPLWDGARTLLNECKEHIRNDLLLKRQLEVVDGLSSLTQRSADNHSALYDKMGRIRRKR